MELILWRVADADDTGPDLERRLNAKGRRRAERVAQWLEQRLPARYALLTSPAVRARQTAETLGVPARTEPQLGPGAEAARILAMAGWPAGKGAVVIVGHQPDLGRVIGSLLSEGRGRWSVKKGGLWWLTNRERSEKAQVVVRAVVSPDLL
ncbi:MAG: SixA phosphatase family protein [Betaproteobacteria bacterium]